MNKLTERDQLLLEGLETRYGSEAVADAIASTDIVEDENTVAVVSAQEAILKFIQFLEGCHVRVKELHWEADHSSAHELADDMHSKILEYEDEVAEDMMGFLGIRIKPLEIKPIAPSARTIKELLDEIDGVVTMTIASVEDDPKCRGLVSILEDMLHWINKSKYLETME